jgi:hypothetical protein
VDKLREKMVNKLMKEENKSNSEENSVQKNKDKELWRIGIICKKDCFCLTEEILKILLNMGYEWKIVSSSYKIKCRKRVVEENQIVEKMEANPLIVEIKIFGEIEHDNKEEFLVDIHKKSGAVMEFLQFSSTLISSMQKEGFVVFK